MQKIQIWEYEIQASKAKQTKSLILFGLHVHEDTNSAPINCILQRKWSLLVPKANLFSSSTFTFYTCKKPI